MSVYSKTSGPEPTYDNIASGYQTFHYEHSFHLRYGIIPELKIAYETWGELNEAKDNVVLVSTGLSGSSHARSHKVMFDNYVGPRQQFILVYITFYFVINANIVMYE